MVWTRACSALAIFALMGSLVKSPVTRTKFWRFYDWMWGLHIMDLGGRENTHNPWIVGFGILTLVTTVLAIVLLPLTGKRRRRKG